MVVISGPLCEVVVVIEGVVGVDVVRTDEEEEEEKVAVAVAASGMHCA
jgi:hypothetical protein